MNSNPQHEAVELGLSVSERLREIGCAVGRFASFQVARTTVRVASIVDGFQQARRIDTEMHEPTNDSRLGE